MVELQNLSLPLSYDEEGLRRAAAARLGVASEDILRVGLLRRSVDARKKSDVHFVAAVSVMMRTGEAELLSRGTVRALEPCAPQRLVVLPSPPKTRPVVCGAGPAGLFAALSLARAGARPLLVDRGGAVAARREAIDRFRKTRVLDTESNVQFGEGGAGAFSDGKLNTGIGDPRCRRVLRELYNAGAPEDILWQAKPHIGTDLLPEVLKGLRSEILKAGGEVRFFARLRDILLQDGALRAVVIESNGKAEEIDSRILVLATGHSARDVYALLHTKEAQLRQKPFSIGLRVEHKQRLIDEAQYGRFAGHPALGAADYRLSCHLPSGRSVYTFCMCPGGEVMAAASEEGGLVTNGMSRFSRDGDNANAALLAGVTPADFGSEHPLAGIEFQRRWERAAFALGGGDYTAPAQLMGDFLRGRPSRSGGGIRPSYPLGVRYGDLSGCLPDFAARALRESIPMLDRRLRGFAAPDAVLTGVESRSSSPLRILRDESGQSNLRGVFPCGEGAGYAGGILSAAVDGLRTAEAVLRRLL
jgi:uncharacterized FAD-dependent dehydrogenase